MPLLDIFKRLDEAEQEFQKAAQLRNPERKGFDLQLAFQHLKRAIALKPNETRYHAELGFTYLLALDLALRYGVKPGFKLSQSAELALAALKEALRRKPDYSAAAVNLVLSHLYLGQKKEAWDVARSIKDSKANQFATKLVQMQTKAGQDKVGETKRRFKQALDYMSMGRERQAKKEFEQAYTILSRDLAEAYRVICDMAG